MRKLIWVCSCVLLLAYVATYFRTAAFDYQLTHKTWIQVATADGCARLVVVSGDPSASSTAHIVIERDKNSWRHDASAAQWSRVPPWEGPVDTLGTIVLNYQFKAPLAPVLVPLAFMLAIWVMERWGASLGLVWAELWTTPQFGRGAFGIVRRVLLAVSIVFAFGAALLWAASHVDPLPRLCYLGDHVAFVTGEDDFDVSVLFKPSGAGPNAPDKSFAEIIDERIDELGRPKKYCSVQVTRERIAFRYYTADVTSGSVVMPVWHELAVFEFGQDRVELPYVASPLPMTEFGGPVGTTVISTSSATAGLERTVILPLWSLVTLFGPWPLWCFLRGPVRRARRRAAGCCPPCGYNLTGLIDPRCPECGTAFDPESVGWAGKPAC